MKSNIKTAKSYLVLILIGMFAVIFVLNKLIASGDATGTANNFITSESMWGKAADRVMHVLDVPIMWINYFFSC